MTAPRPDLDALRELMARLRAPDGCPWDREQTLPDLRAYLLEEAHEVAAAIDARDWAELGAELGDLLFQIVFLSRLAEEAGQFALPDVVAGIWHKMVERHPHVFGPDKLADAAEVRGAWERRKAAKAQPGRSVLAGVASSLPALLAAYRMTQKAGGVGFDWPDATGVLDKVEEEIGELRVELAGSAAGGGAKPDREAVKRELGDLLFTLANLARKLDIDPEAALAETNREFRRRFAHVERRVAESGRVVGEVALAELDGYWDEAKRQPREP